MPMENYTPVIALATGLVEVSAFIFFFKAFKHGSRHLKTLVAILFFLAGYQLLEAYNCTYPNNPLMVRLSFIDITLLPVLGVYFTYLTATSNRLNIWRVSFVFWLAASFFVLYFIFSPASVQIKSCQSFFATYSNSQPVYRFFGIYYQLGMLMMVVFSIYNMVNINNLQQRKLIADFASGSVLFIIPSILISGFVTNYYYSMPSVMCHIALILSVFIIKALYREYKFSLSHSTFGKEVTHELAG